MTKMMKKAIVACVLVTTVGLTAAPVLAAGIEATYRTGRVEAFSTQTWRMSTDYTSFEVAVRGDGDTDLDVFVYDAVTGRFLGSDTDYTDRCFVSGYSDSGRLLIKVRNLGDVWNRYVMRVE